MSAWTSWHYYAIVHSVGTSDDHLNGEVQEVSAATAAAAAEHELRLAGISARDIVSLGVRRLSVAELKSAEEGTA